MARPQKLSDPRVLRAIAHPVRARILEELSASGPVRAADVARELGIPANQASFHLRQLAKYGLVEEAPEEARDKRDRVWRAASAQGFSVDLSVLAEEPGGRAAVEVFRANKLAGLHAVVERAFSMGRDGARGTFTTTDHALRLTDEEAHQLRQELDDVVDAWSTRTRGRDAGRRTYMVVHMIQPYPEVGEGAAEPATGPEGEEA